MTMYTSCIYIIISFCQGQHHGHLSGGRKDGIPESLNEKSKISFRVRCTYSLAHVLGRCLGKYFDPIVPGFNKANRELTV